MANVSTLKSSLSDIIRTNIDKVLLDLNVCLPAKVLSYDSATQFADVQVQLFQNVNGNLVAFPPIPNVPVKHPRANGGKAFIHMPLAAGDDVILVFSQRSLDNWKSSGGMTDPADPRKHHLTDAYALVGGSALPDAFTVGDPTAIEVKNDQALFQLLPSGKFKVSNGTNELIDLMDQLLDTLINQTFTLTLLGPEPFIASTNQTLQQIKDKLETLKV